VRRARGLLWRAGHLGRLTLQASGGSEAWCRGYAGDWAGSLRYVDTVSAGGGLVLAERAGSVPDVTFCLAFGCEELSVPVMRQVLGDTLRGLGVEEESVYDLLLAATEACTSVLGTTRGPGYAVVTSLQGTGCRVEVQGPRCRDRSLAVARACVDDVTLRSRPGRGTVVIMSKHIAWAWDAPLRRVAALS
jgi:serine/threonine-protein kinase RsbW